MQLPDQLIKKLRLLIDKPISPKVNKQLLPLLLHQNLQVDKAIPVLLIKHRCDLLNHLLQNDRYPSESTKNSMLSSILTNILQYKIAQILQLYILLLTKIDDDKKILEIGYYNLVKLAIKQPNLQIKEKLFEIILSNCEYFYKRKCKKVIMAIFENYIQVFNKFLIYVPSYVSIIELALQIDKNSKIIINKQHPQRQKQLQEIFIDFSSQQLSTIKNQIINILQNSKDKLNYYSLHRNCLNALKKIGDIINDFKVKESELHFTQLEVGQICRVIQIFSDRKGTIDQAKFAKIVWLKRFNNLKKIKQLKSQKYMNVPSEPSLILDRKQVQKPLFIQQVISMTNNYRLKYQVSPQEQQASPSRIMAVSNNFLKKGIGIGGGRTHLLNQKHQIVFRDEKLKNKRIYDGIVNKCFQQCQKDIQYKSFVVPRKPAPQTPKYLDIQALNQTPIKSLRNNQTSQLQQHVHSLTNFSQKRYKSPNYQHDRDQVLERTAKSSLYQDDEQIEEINNLIQLAYSYKFS